MPVFSHTTVPPLISLLNSNSIPALSPLWRTTTDPSLPEDSVVCLLQDDASEEGYDVTHGFESIPKTPLNASVSLVPKRSTPIGSLAQPVIHLQSPTIRTTYIQAGALLPSPDALGIGLPFLGMQVKPLGERPFTMEVGVVDHAGNQGRIRVSTFQTTPALRYSTSSPPVLHVPLRLPSSNATSLTPWTQIHLHIPSLLPLFSSTLLQPLPQTPDSTSATRNPLPRNYASITYIRLYASCRVKRVWMAARGGEVERGGEAVGDEWGLYARRL